MFTVPQEESIYLAQWDQFGASFWISSPKSIFQWKKMMWKTMKASAIQRCIDCNIELQMLL